MPPSHISVPEDIVFDTAYLYSFFLQLARTCEQALLLGVDNLVSLVVL